MNNNLCTTKITWLNAEAMMFAAEQAKDEAFLDLKFLILNEIARLGGKDSISSWCGAEDYDCEDEEGEYIGSLEVVSYNITNEKWPWDQMVKDILTLSAEDRFKDILFELKFMRGEASGKTFICGGKHTAALYDREANEFVLAF